MDKFQLTARLHSSSITTGFISKLGSGFLSSLYRAIHRSPYSVLIIDMDDSGRIKGFVSGSLSTSKMYKWILLRYSHVFVFKLLGFAMNPKNLIRIIQTMTYTLKKSNNGEKRKAELPEAELLSIAVDSNSRKKGVGKRLVKDLEKWFKENGVDSYKTLTWSKDEASNRFYQSCGFKVCGSIKHHENVLNVYERTLP